MSRRAQSAFGESTIGHSLGELRGSIGEKSGLTEIKRRGLDATSKVANALHISQVVNAVPFRPSFYKSRSFKANRRRAGHLQSGDIDLGNEVGTPHINPEHAATIALLRKTIRAVNCEFAELIPAPGESTLSPLAAMHHVHTQPFTPTPWSNEETTPVGLCARTRAPVFVECAHTDARFHGIPYEINRISMLLVRRRTGPFLVPRTHRRQWTRMLHYTPSSRRSSACR